MTRAGVWYRFRAEARRRLGAWIMLGALFGLAAGAVIAAVAGASRTSSAYDRFFEAHLGLDAAVAPIDYCETCDARLAEDLPMIRDSVRILSANVAGARVNGREVTASAGAFLFAGTTDGRIGREVNRWHLLEGRLPDPAAPEEILVSRDIATRMPLYVDDHLEVDLYIGPFGEEELATVELEVVGIEVSPIEFEPLSGGAVNVLYTGPAFAEAHPEVFPVEVLGVVLEDDPDARGALAQAIAPLDLTIFPLIDSERQATAARDRFRDNAAGLLVFAGLGALTVLVLAGQALHRQHVLDTIDRDRLSSVGWSRCELRRVAWLRSGVVALAGTACAVVAAVAVSPLMPVGEARAIEPRPGVTVDVKVVSLGAIGVFVALSLIGALAAEGPIRTRTGASRRIPTRVLTIRQSLPGLRLRLASALGYAPSDRAVPLMSVVTGLVVSIIAVTGAATFAVGLDHLEHTPALYGQPWDAVVVVEDAEDYLETAEEEAIYEATRRGEDTEASFELLGDIVPERAARRLAGQAGIEAVSLGTTNEVVIDGRTETGSLSLYPIIGDLQASLISGRLPTAEGEVTMGSRLLDEHGLKVGDTVAVGMGSDGPESDASERRIVGRTVTANLGLVDALGGGIVEPGHGGDLIFLRFTTTAAKAELMDDFDERGLFISTDFEQDGRLLDLGGAQATPGLIAALTAVLGLATLVHFGVVSVGRHAHHFGVLRALGLRRRDCRSVLVWHGLLVGGLALAIGVPSGIALGRAAWVAYANGLYVVPRPPLPEPWFAVPPAVTVVLISLAMAVPAHIALRHSAADGLRAE